MPYNVRGFWFWWKKCPICFKWMPDIETILLNHIALIHTNYTPFDHSMPKTKYFNRTMDNYILMPTAQELGLIESGFGSPFAVGDKVELSKLPEFGHSEELDCETVAISSTKGLRSTTSKTIIGQLRSDNPKSVGGLLRQALNVKNTLTVWVIEKPAVDNNGDETGYNNLSLNIFAPKK